MVSPAATLHTDESKVYSEMALHYTGHETVNHSIREYARGDVTTNNAEGFFGRLERSVMGIHHRIQRPAPAPLLHAHGIPAQHAQGHGRCTHPDGYPDE